MMDNNLQVYIDAFAKLAPDVGFSVGDTQGENAYELPGGAFINFDTPLKLKSADITKVIAEAKREAEAESKKYALAAGLEAQLVAMRERLTEIGCPVDDPAQLQLLIVDVYGLRDSGLLTPQIRAAIEGKQTETNLSET